MRPQADDILLFLEVVRHGSYSAAAAALGVNHTTVSRRMTALEKAVGGALLSRAAGTWEPTELGRRYVEAGESIERAITPLEHAVASGHVTGLVRTVVPDAFGAAIMSRVAVMLNRDHPGIQVEMINSTRQASLHSTGEDFLVTVGRVELPRRESLRFADYRLGLYASRDYLAAHGRPVTLAQVATHPLVYYVESAQDVSALDFRGGPLLGMRQAVSATSSLVHVGLTRAGAGIGLLPRFLADSYPDLVRVLPEEIDFLATYWASARPEALRRPAVRVVLAALNQVLEAMRPTLNPAELPRAARNGHPERVGVGHGPRPGRGLS